MFKDYLASSKQNIEQWLGEVLNSPNQEFKPLYESMNYSLMQGGKRIRPILSKAVLEKAHNIRNANPLSHASAELLEKYTTEEIKRNIEDLNGLIECYIENKENN